MLGLIPVKDKVRKIDRSQIRNGLQPDCRERGGST